MITFLLVFLSGSVVGAIAFSALRPTPNVQAETIARTLDWDNAGGNLAGELTTELQLDEQQKAQLTQVLNDFFLYYHELQDQMDEVRAAGKVKILEILRPEQKKQFEQWIAGRTD
jgi:Spy/CpxP family protein refolding chaperone